MPMRFPTSGKAKSVVSLVCDLLWRYGIGDEGRNDVPSAFRARRPRTTVRA